MTAATGPAAEVSDLMIANRFQVVGVNDDRDYCECCGRKGLKRVVWVRDIETDEVKHFGTTCALAPSKSFGIDSEVRDAIRNYETGLKVRWAIAHKEYRAAGGEYGPCDKGVFPVLDRPLLDHCFAEAKTS